ncbi:hypothetical protein CVT25_002355 [Psilocybe cyanescens]|uniref:Chitin synthase export chaperone n=1 Tax=Psilocybe cyanescens TaxID=93625 RepID=A0A409WKK2_PSICY|nr:hypothetical protein CVT25_002355 [Psilocybe cyanescens]
MLVFTNRASDSLVELLQRDEQVDVKPIGTHFIAAFDSLYLVSLLSLLAIFSTACASPRIRRFSTWYTFLLAWIFEAVSKLLLVGQQTSPIPPQFGICVAQASLINAIPVLCAFYAVTYILQTYLTVMAILKSETTVSKSRVRLLHALPCAAFIALFILSLTAIIATIVDSSGSQIEQRPKEVLWGCTAILQDL